MDSAIGEQTGVSYRKFPFPPRAVINYFQRANYWLQIPTSAGTTMSNKAQEEEAGRIGSFREEICNLAT
jgi:hypothetical protein